MRKLYMAVCMVLVFTGVAGADTETWENRGYISGVKETVSKTEYLKISELIEKIPIQKQSIAYSITDSVFRYNNIFISKDLKIKWLDLNIGLGIIPNEDELTFNVGTTLVKFDDVKILENIPIVKWFEISPYMYGGFKRINGINANQKENSEFDFGGGVILLSLKFG